MEKSIYCLMVGGRGLSDISRTLLYRTACEMVEKGKMSQSIKSNVYEGIIKNEYKSIMIGSVGGIKFIADFETDLGKNHVEFILQNRDVDKSDKDGIWVELPPRQPSFDASLN